MKILKGLGAAEGIAFANAFVLKTNKFSGNRTSITEDKIPSEIEALKIALAKSKDEVASFQKKAYADGADEQGDVFGAYMEILDDEEMFKDTVACIKEKLVDMNTALMDVCGGYGGVGRSLYAGSRR